MAKEIRTEADRVATPRPTPTKGFSMPVSRGQKISLERGTSTRSKKTRASVRTQGG